MSVRNLIFFVLIVNLISLSANESQYRLYFDKDQKELLCSQTQLEEGEDITTVIPVKGCLENSNQLKTPMEYVLSETNKCFAFTDTQPPYFVGLAPDQSHCANKEQEELDITPNVLKYSNHRIEQLCQELGTCLSALSLQSQRTVDYTIEILKKLRIKSRLEHMKKKVGREKFYEDLPEFLKYLSMLEGQNERCANNLSYGDETQIVAKDALAHDLSRVSGVLEDDLYVFHWYTSSLSKMAIPKNGNSSIVATKYAEMLQDNYFEKDQDGGTGLQGRGLYASPNPRATESYGNILLKIKIPSGSRYINMGRYDLPLSKHTINSLKAAGCNLERDSGYHIAKKGNTSYVNKAAFSSTDGCREIYNEVIKKEKYVFQSYEYGYGQTSVCQNEFSEAFVLINNDLTKENVMAYDNPFGNSSEESSQEVQELKDLATDYYNISKQRRDELSSKYKDHLWNCR